MENIEDNVAVVIGGTAVDSFDTSYHYRDAQVELETIYNKIEKDEEVEVSFQILCQLTVLLPHSCILLARKL